MRLNLGLWEWSKWKDDYSRTHSNTVSTHCVLGTSEHSPRCREHRNECDKWSSTSRLGWQGHLGVQAGMDCEQDPGRTVGRVRRRGRRMGV